MTFPLQNSLQPHYDAELGQKHRISEEHHLAHLRYTKTTAIKSRVRGLPYGEEAPEISKFAEDVMAQSAQAERFSNPNKKRRAGPLSDSPQAYAAEARQVASFAMQSSKPPKAEKTPQKKTDKPVSLNLHRDLFHLNPQIAKGGFSQTKATYPKSCAKRTTDHKPDEPSRPRQEATFYPPAALPKKIVYIAPPTPGAVRALKAPPFPEEWTMDGTETTPDNFFYVTEETKGAYMEMKTQGVYQGTSKYISSDGIERLLIRQEGRKDCGSAALLMVLSSYTYSGAGNLSFTKRFAHLLGGSLNNKDHIKEQLNNGLGTSSSYKAESHKIPLEGTLKFLEEHLDNSKFPLIISITHPQLAGHWVVLDSRTSEAYDIRDPHTGKAYRIPKDTMARYLTDDECPEALVKIEEK